jgi:hypothetical protein
MTPSCAWVGRGRLCYAVWLFRIDFMHRAMVNADRYPGVKPPVPEEVKVTDELPIGEENRRKLYHLNGERVSKL